MASPLTVTHNNSAGIGATKAQANGDVEAQGGVLGAFAALLGAANQQAEASADVSLGNVVNLSFGAGFGNGEGKEAEDPDVIAAAIDVALPIQAPIVSYPVLTELVDSLADLKSGLDAGTAIDPKLLARVNAALDNLAAQFDIDLASLPSLDDLKALTAAILPEDASVDAQLTAVLAPLAAKLLEGTSETSADAELSGLVKSIGEKLASLLQSLNSGDIDPDKLAALGLDADASVDADLESAIAKLLNPPAKVDASAAAQVLAAPTLKLTEPVLTGKAGTEATVEAEPAAKIADAAEPTLKVGAVATANKDTDTGGTSDGKSSDDKQVDAKAPVAVAVVSETKVDPQVAAQPTHVVSRIDAAAARPVVQTGYQTSQQQLNLPQLAFELVRQVNDGNTRFQMRLDPPELGKIDVRLDIDASGQVNARLTVEKAETLDLMQRDRQGLEKALQQAGLDSAKANLEFSLKQSPFSGGQQGQDGSARQPMFGSDGTAEAEDLPAPTVNLYRGSLTASGVNIIA